MTSLLILKYHNKDTTVDITNYRISLISSVDTINFNSCRCRSMWMCGHYSRVDSILLELSVCTDTIQGRTLFKCGN